MITYKASLENIAEDMLWGFMQHWGIRPSPETLLRILQASSHIILALDDENVDIVVGFITAISDGISCAYISHLEVREEFQGEGIGSELVRRMVDKLKHIYMIDLCCDPELQLFYFNNGFKECPGMVIRNYDRKRCD